MNDDIKPWEILFDAAQRIDMREEYRCCEAIDESFRYLCAIDLSHEYWTWPVHRCTISAFRLFSPCEIHIGESWWPDESDDSQAERVLALLFAAEISKDQWK